MSKFLVRDIVQDKETNSLVTVELELDAYCSLLSSKIICIVKRYEEITGSLMREDDILRSNCFDAVGLAKRLPKNIFVSGDHNEEL